MYTKKISELRVLMIAVVILAVASVTAVIAVVWGSTAALAFFGGALLVGVLVEARPERKEVHELRNASHEAGPHGGRHVLVVANAPLAGEQLARDLQGHGEIDVLAPPLPSRVHLAVTDVDHELADARSRLEQSLAWADAHGLAARGEVGDPSTFTGIADELRGFGADEVFVVFRAGDTVAAGHEIERLREDLSVPVRVVAV